MHKWLLSGTKHRVAADHIASCSLPLICRTSVPRFVLIPHGREGLQVNPINLLSPFNPPLYSPQTCKGKETSQSHSWSSGELYCNHVGWKADSQLKELLPSLGFGDKPCGIAPGEKACPPVEKKSTKTPKKLCEGIFLHRFPSPEPLPVGLNYNGDSSDHCKCWYNWRKTRIYVALSCQGVISSLWKWWLSPDPKKSWMVSNSC